MKKVKAKKTVGKVGIILGSERDLPYMEGLFEYFNSSKIGYDLEIASCHRNHRKVDAIIKKWKNKKVIIAAAGYAAHLPGYIVSHSDLPVIGIPLPTSDLGGLDSILSIAQLPKGFACMTSGIGKAGAVNTGMFVKKILNL